MRRLTGFLASGLRSAVLLALCLVAVLLVFVLAARQEPAKEALAPGGATPTEASTPIEATPTVEEAYPWPTSYPTSTPVQYPLDTPSPWPTRDLPPTWTPEPTPTIPPLLTPLPTPEVTPIPTTAPPVIPDVIGRAKEPFWIIYWRDNEIWRIDERGQDRELLLDTYERLGQWLTAHPIEGVEGWDGPRVVLSPDGSKLALVVVDKIRIAKGEPFTYSIYVFDIQTGNLSRVSEGVQPVWAPDGQRIAFLKEGDIGGLWIADLQTGRTYEKVPAHEKSNSGVHIGEFAWTMDSTRIAYAYDDGPWRIPEIWVAHADEETPPQQVFTQQSPMYGLTWSADGEQIFFVSREDARDKSSVHRVLDLWSISLVTGQKTRWTRDMVVERYVVSPYGRWLAISGWHLYEKPEDHVRDLWALGLDENDLRRITVDQGNLVLVGFAPDGMRLIVRRVDTTPLLYSLRDGTSTVLDYNFGSNYEVGGAR